MLYSRPFKDKGGTTAGNRQLPSRKEAQTGIALQDNCRRSQEVSGKETHDLQGIGEEIRQAEDRPGQGADCVHVGVATQVYESNRQTENKRENVFVSPFV